MSSEPIPTISYIEPESTATNSKQLVASPGTPQERRFPFFDRIEIARHREGRECLPGILYVPDPTVSSRHCSITQTADGRCFVRDMSRNGTRLDGRRLVPNAEVEIKVVQTISIGAQNEFLLTGTRVETTPLDPTGDGLGTLVEQVSAKTVTVLVGDIRDYTVLVQRPESIAIQQAIRRVFDVLQDEVARLGGTVKEFRGDAILAFWEEELFENQAVEACRSALALDELARKLASDNAIWNLQDVTLHIEWAAATGPVTIDSIGGDHAAGLSLIGAPVVLAFRIEKYADDETGSIVVCPTTRDQAREAFKFEDLGEKHCKGFDDPIRIYALVGPR